jgi:hypothetical protein
MRTLLKLALAVVVAVFVSAGFRYHQWVTQSASPFDEVGIELHKYMPAPVQDWGCAQLKARFDGKTLPPYGCQSTADPRKWRSAS